MSWQKIIKGNNPIVQAMKLVQDWKPETEEGEKYRKELEEVVAPLCPKGSEWCSECKQCETPEQSKEIHGD
jgi:hypothetical protein